MKTENAAGDAIARAFLRAEGMPVGFDQTIHPDDEMFHTVRDVANIDARFHSLEYFRGGFESLRLLESVLRAAGKSWADVGRMLDYACGYGRLARLLVTRLEPHRIWGSDIQADASAFCEQAFGIQTVPALRRAEDLELPGSFDVIFVGSLFSHLPRRSFEPLLRRLLRALSPEGLLVFSTHGADVIPEVVKNANGFTFEASSESARLDVDEYGSTFITPTLAQKLSKACGAVDVVTAERSLWWLQDVHVATRQPRPELARWCGHVALQGRMMDLAIESDGQAQVRGWAMVRRDRAPIEEVCVILDDQDPVPALLGPPHPSVLGEEAREGFVQREWLLEGPLPALAGGLHTLAITGRAGGCASQCLGVDAFEFRLGEPVRRTVAEEAPS